MRSFNITVTSSIETELQSGWTGFPQFLQSKEVHLKEFLQFGFRHSLVIFMPEFGQIILGSFKPSLKSFSSNSGFN